MYREVTYTVEFRDRDLPGLLDMLRYDQPVVVTWDRVESGPTGFNRFRVTLRGKSPTVDRWSSFGLYVKEV